jgi:hypothetical protein
MCNVDTQELRGACNYVLVLYLSFSNVFHLANNHKLRSKIQCDQSPGTPNVRDGAMTIAEVRVNARALHSPRRTTRQIHRQP